ncbi:hypothetical protein VXO75_08390 [Acinetobacter towneri]
MSQDQLINRRYIRMPELATTAERKERIYINKNGKQIIIKAKP